MKIPYELALGWRYTRAGRATRRNGFISFISGVSMLGIALGVAALIIVLSVMNGFQKEVRDRMLSVVSHIEIFAPQGAALPDPARTLAEAKQNPNVIGAAPFVAAQALLARGEDMKGALVRGIDPALEGAVTDLAATNEKTLNLLVPGEFRVVLGSELARALDETRLFPALLVHLVASGETSGRLEQMLERAAQLETRALERRLAVFLTLLEPLMILLMGGVVLMIVLAILLPIMEINQLVN